jgi:hypothetical protein
MAQKKHHAPNMNSFSFNSLGKNHNLSSERILSFGARANNDTVQTFGDKKFPKFASVEEEVIRKNNNHAHNELTKIVDYNKIQNQKSISERARIIRKGMKVFGNSKINESFESKENLILHETMNSKDFDNSVETPFVQKKKLANKRRSARPRNEQQLEIPLIVRCA